MLFLTMSLIPHHKIEKRILQHGLRYIFIRPAYFMQNLFPSPFPGSPHISEVYRALFKRSPATVGEFLEREAHLFTP